MSFITPDAFELLNVWFYTNRLFISNEKNSQNKIDISNSLAEISIYENIGIPYLTANMTYVDDLNLFEMPGVIGTERIELNVATPITSSSSEQYITTKRFVISGINASQKSNESVSVYNISLIEDHGYFNFVQKISRSYYGKGEDIIKKILSDTLSKELELGLNDFKPFKESVQDPMRYNIPYIRPLDAAKVILSNMTTPHGMPYFLYSTIHSDRLILTDLETILENKPFNKDKVATFSPASSYTGGNILDQMFNISKYAISSSPNEETLKLADKGGLGFKYENINGSSGSYYNQSLNYKNFILPWLQNIDEATGNNALGLLVDDDLFDPDPANQFDQDNDTPRLGEYNSSVFSNISADNFLPNKEIGISGNKTFLNDVVRDATMFYLTKNVYDIEMSGLAFLFKDVYRCVGGQINISVNEDNGLSSSYNKSSRSEKKSGNYVILTKHHLFTPHNNKHRVSMQVSRITNRVSRDGVRMVEMLPSAQGSGPR